ncbi:hypothetical protein GBA52_020454 [Prunus armeniaca]|nr:hypothetical protein GBA52_020454 [Prunus armeniaca]
MLTWDFVKAIDDFHEKYCIGKGGFERVYKAELLSGQVVAQIYPSVSSTSSEDPPQFLFSLEHYLMTVAYSSGGGWVLGLRERKREEQSGLVVVVVMTTGKG